jgi:hypothetical protein
MAEVIDLTVESHDHLTTLPPELLQCVLGYLFPTHDPDYGYKRSLSGWTPPSHDFDALALTCKKLRGEVMNWARLWLVQHKAITNFNETEDSNEDMLRGTISNC